MRRKFDLIVLCIIFCILACSVYGEEDPDWVLPGGMSRGDHLLFAQARMPDTGLKMQVIQDLAARARGGVLSPKDGNSLFILRHLAEEGIRTKVVNSPGRNFPEVRRAACEVLGIVGGPESVEILVSVLEMETEPMVLSEAVFALGKTGVPPDKNIMNLLTKIIATHVIPKMDNNLAFACLLTVEKLERTGTPVDDPLLFRALIRVADGPFIGEVRKKAYEVLDRLRNIY